MTTPFFSTLGLPSFVDMHAVGLREMFTTLATLEHALTLQDNYPPHNIVKINDTTYRIEIAVAGVSPDALEVSQEQRTLIIRAHAPKHTDVQYLHRGVATRKFTKTFILAEHVHVTHADLDNGLLVITLERQIPEHEKPRLIPIQQKQLTA